MKKYLWIVLMLPLLVQAQPDTLKLQECLNWARSNFPLLQKQQLQDEALKLELRNIRSAYLPQLLVNGQLTYQSDVPSLGLPGFPDIDIPKTQYRAALNLEQNIYDGGTSGAQKAVARAEAGASQQQVEVSWQQVKSMLIKLYFGIAMQERSAEIFAASAQLLEEKLRQMDAAVRAGTMLESDLLRVKAQLYEIQKQSSAVKHQRQAALRAMEVLTGKELEQVEGVQLPQTELQLEPAWDSLPQIRLMELQKEKLSASQKLASTRLAPRVSAMATGGVGQPNPYNFFDKDFSTYYLLGAKLQWNVFDWGNSSRTRSSLELNRQMLDTEEEQLKQQVQLKLEELRAEILQLEKSLEKDREIAEMRKSIRKTASSQLDEGTLTPADYLETLIEEQQALQNLQIDELRLTKTKIEYAIEAGNF